MLRSILLVLLLASASAADGLEDILKRMDDAALKFQGLSAQLAYTKVTLVVNDTSEEKGTIYFQKEKGGKGYKVKIEITHPDSSAKTVLVRGGKAQIYRPKINQIEEYDVGKKKELMEQFLLLGFGAGGHELAKAYDVKLGDSCNLNGAACIKLDLMPKGDMTRNLKKVELWLSPETTLPIQQRFTEPTNDHSTASYQQMKPGLQPDSVFHINAPRAKTVKPGQE